MTDKFLAGLRDFSPFWINIKTFEDAEYAEVTLRLGPLTEEDVGTRKNGRPQEHLYGTEATECTALPYPPCLFEPGDAVRCPRYGHPRSSVW